MFKEILFATTASPACDDAARVAFDLAKRYDANLTALHIIGIPSRGYSPTVVDIRSGEEISCDEDYLEWVKDEMKNTYARQIEQFQKCSIEAVAGVPYREILRSARKKGIDLIIMGASSKIDEEKTGYRRYIAGSTLQAVAKAARCPVLIIGRPAASFWGGISSIVFSTDFSKASDAAFKFAYNTAKTLGCTLYIFHVLDISSIHSGKIVSQDEIEDRIREARQKIRKKYVARIKEFDDYEIEIWEGIPYVEIVKFARENYCDLIVMAHHTKEADLAKLQFGSTLEQVVLRASCPVVSVTHEDKL